MLWPDLQSLLTLVSLSGALSTLADRSPVADFERLCGYLGAESGVWLAPNPDRDAPEANEPDAFDLTFVCDDARRVLTMEIGSRYRDGTRRVGWRAVWFWHPGRQEIVYLSYAKGNIIEGVTKFAAEDVFVTTYVRYRPDGTESRGRDENTMLNDHEHRTATFSFEDGEWSQRGGLLWSLQPEGGEG